MEDKLVNLAPFMLTTWVGPLWYQIGKGGHYFPEKNSSVFFFSLAVTHGSFTIFLILLIAEWSVFLYICLFVFVLLMHLFKY